MKYLKFTTFTSLIFLTFSAFVNAQIVPNAVNQQPVKQINNDETEKFLNVLKVAITKDDPKELARFISYPCRWNKASGVVMINNQNDFISSYKLIMSKAIKDSILTSKVSRMLATDQGFASDGGRVWFHPKKGIFAINTLD